MIENQQFELAVIVVNFRAAEMTMECMSSVLAQLGALDCLVVVDNNSADHSVEQLENWIENNDEAKRVQLVISSINGGFAAGNNLGIGSIQAQSYLLLNNDTILRPQALDLLKVALNIHPDSGAIGCRLEDLDGTPQVSRFRDHTPFSELISAAATGPVTRFLKRYDVPIEVADEAKQADWLSFACILIPRIVIENVGLLDEGFFMYFEDAEYCRRIRQSGRKLHYEPRARVIHLHGMSSGVPSDKRNLRRLPGYYYRSRWRYFRLTYGPFGPLAANICWTFGRAISLFRESLGKAPHTPKLQWWDIWMARCRVPRGNGMGFF